MIFLRISARVCFAVLSLAGMLALPHISPAQSSAKSVERVVALRAEPGELSVYEISFVTQALIPKDAAFVLSFPDSCDLSQLQMAGSNQINGGFRVEKDGTIVRVIRSALGDVIPAGRPVAIRLGAIVNPKDLESRLSIRFQSQASSSAALGSTRSLPLIFESPSSKQQLED